MMYLFKAIWTYSSKIWCELMQTLRRVTMFVCDFIKQLLKVELAGFHFLIRVGKLPTIPILLGHIYF